MSRLTKKRQKFIDEYLQCFNATEAAKKAGYKESNAASTGCNLLKTPIITNIIDERLEELKMDADEALRLLADKARNAESESVQVRALETIIKVHGLAEKPLDGELVLRVVRENVGSQDFSQNTTSEAADHSGESV